MNNMQNKGSSSGAPRVLIVEDCAAVRRALRVLLEIEGAEVVGEAGDGLAAVDLIDSVHPDVVILDFQMPLMDGAATAARLRALLPAAAIIAFSASLDGRPDWADAYLPKDRLDELPDMLDGLALTA